MPWGKLDDKFHRNAKVRALRRMGARGREALGCWVFWWSWCLDDAELTGFVPIDELPAADAKAAALLVDVGLWDEAEGGYAFHDFGQYNPKAAQVAAKKEADRLRVAAKREEEKRAKAAATSGGVAQESPASRADVACDTDATNTRVASTRVPSPPDPIPADDVQSADAGGEPPEPPERELPIDHHTVGREWQVAYASAGHTLSHGSDQWRGDFGLIASAIRANVPDGHRHTASRALCRWFWLAPDGPIRGERIIPGYAFPSVLAKRVDADLERARLWWNQQRQQAQEAAQ